MAKGIKTGGRIKGTPNKNSAIIRVFCNYIADSGYDKFKAEFEKLEGKQYIEIFLKLAKIAVDDNTSVIANDGLIKMLNEKIKQNGTNK